MAKKKQSVTTEEMLGQVLVPEDDNPHEVPANWVWVKLGSITKMISKGTTPKGGKDSYLESGIGFLRVENIGDDGYIDLSSVKYIDEETHAGELKRSILKDGDVLISIAGTLGRTAIIKKEFLPLNTNQALAFIRLEEKLLAYGIYIEKALSSPVINNGLLKQTKVTSIPNLTLEIVSNCHIPLPPLAEQQRIVAITESLFEKLDRAKELAQNALDSFENRKSAILHKAFTGELTRKWREENGVKSADDIVTELYNYRLGLSKTSAERDKIQTVFEYQECHDNESLSESWRYVALEKLCESFQYGTSKKSENQGEVVVLRMGNLQSGKIDWSNLAYTSDEGDIKKYILRKGDVLFNRTNSSELVGKTSIYEGEKPAIFAGYLIKIKNFKCLNSHYLNYAMNTSFAKDYCMSVKSDGVNQSNINAQKLAKLEIPFCSQNEQNEIVRILDNLLENEQKAKELCDVIDKIDHMKKSILARAFRGELGTNNPDEESALELLKAVLIEKG